MKKKSLMIMALLIMVFAIACSKMESSTKPDKEKPDEKVTTKPDKDQPDKKVTAKPIVELKEPEVLKFDSKENGKQLYEWEVEGKFLDNLREYSLKTASYLLKKGEGNTIYSPVSLHLAASIVTEGAKGDTQKQLLEFLNQPDLETLTKGNQQLMKALTINNEMGQLLPTNALWVGEKTRRGEEVKLVDEFVKKVAQEYQAGIFQVDFHNPKTKELLEAWVQERTKGMIKPELVIHKDQVLSVYNTIYFKDQWRNAFAEDSTKEGDFTLGDQSKMKVPYMHGNISGEYYEGEDYTSISLPLRNAGSMIFVKPKESLTPADLSDKEHLKKILDSKMESAMLNVSLPKYKVDNHMELIPLMKEMGVKDAFDDKADFSKLLNIDSLISAVNQDNAVDVNEKGVSAASFTEISLIEKTAAPMPKDFVLDRPFLFIIQDHMRNILFIGVVNNPA